MGEITQSPRSQQASDAGGHQTGRQPGHSARLQSLLRASQAGSGDGTDLPTVKLLRVGFSVNEKDIKQGELGWGRRLVCWVMSEPGRKPDVSSGLFPAAQ